MAVSENNVRVPITIPKELKQQLDNLAKEDKRTFPTYALRFYLTMCSRKRMVSNL